MKPSLYLGTGADGRRVHVPLGSIIHGAWFGASGLGKSKHLQHVVRQLWSVSSHGYRCGTIVIDPHGDLFEDLVADAQLMGLGSRLVVFDPGPAWSPSLNPLAMRYGDVDVASLTLRAVQKACGDQDADQMPRLQRHLRALLRVLEASGLTLLEAYDFLVDPGVRAHLVEKLADERLRLFWERFEQLAPRIQAERLESTENRIDRLVVSSEIMQRVLGAARSSVDIGQVMDEGKHLLVNLGHQNLTHEQRSLLGSLLVETIFETAVRRPRNRRPPCYVVIDEAADFLTGDEDLPRALAQTRKFGVHFLLALQMLAQLGEKHRLLKSAVLTNCNLRCAFGGSREDADILAAELFTGAFHQDEIKHEQFATKFRPVESTRTIHGVSRGAVSSAGGSISSGSSASSGMFLDPDTDVTGLSFGEVSASGAVDSWANADTSAESWVTVPFVEAHEFQERTGVQFRSTEELRERYAALVKCQPERHFYFQFGHHRTATALVTPDVERFPIAPDARERFLRAVFLRTGCMHQVAALDQERAARIGCLRPQIAIKVLNATKVSPTRALLDGAQKTRPKPTKEVKRNGQARKTA